MIASGVKAGDQVITEIPQTLMPGATVKIADGEARAGGEKGKGKGKGKGEGKAEKKSEAKSD